MAFKYEILISDDVPGNPGTSILIKHAKGYGNAVCIYSDKSNRRRTLGQWKTTWNWRVFKEIDDLTLKSKQGRSIFRKNQHGDILFESYGKFIIIGKDRFRQYVHKYSRKEENGGISTIESTPDNFILDLWSAPLESITFKQK